MDVSILQTTLLKLRSITNEQHNSIIHVQAKTCITSFLLNSVKLNYDFRTLHLKLFLLPVIVR